MTDDQRTLYKYTSEFGDMCNAESKMVKSICTSIDKGEYSRNDVCK